MGTVSFSAPQALKHLGGVEGIQIIHQKAIAILLPRDPITFWEW